MHIAIPSTRSEMNVTPLVDVVLVLLIIFMVTTPLATERISVDAVEQDRREDGTGLVVHVDARGAFSLEGHAIADTEYSARLAAELARHSELPVVVTAESAAPYQRVITALDGARAAGAKSLGVSLAPAAQESESP